MRDDVSPAVTVSNLTGAEHSGNMRWLPFAILLYVTAVLQTAFAPFVAIHTVQPDFLVILAVYYALHARRYDALIACWIIGLMIDLSGMSYLSTGYSNLGVSAFALGLIAFLIVNIREAIVRDSAATQLVMTFGVKMLLGMMTGCHMLYVLGAWNRMGDLIAITLWQAVYTSAIALYGHWVLKHMRFVLGVGIADGLRTR